MKTITLKIKYTPEHYNEVAQATVPECYTGQLSNIWAYGFFGHTRQEVIDSATAELKLQGINEDFKIIDA